MTDREVPPSLLAACSSTPTEGNAQAREWEGGRGSGDIKVVKTKGWYGWKKRTWRKLVAFGVREAGYLPPQQLFSPQFSYSPAAVSCLWQGFHFFPCHAEAKNHMRIMPPARNRLIIDFYFLDQCLLTAPKS